MKRVSSGIAVIALSCFAALGGCVGSMPSKMVIEVDGDSAYEAVITIIEGDDSLEKIWQRTGRPRGVPLIPVKAPDPNRAKGGFGFPQTYRRSGDKISDLDILRTNHVFTQYVYFIHTHIYIYYINI